MPTTSRRPATPPTLRRLATGLLGGALRVSAVIAPASAAAVEPVAPELRPTIHYEESQRHANDRIAFTPGERVTVAFRPRAGDTTLVGGAPPRALPAGRLSGKAMVAEAAAPADAPAALPSPTVEPTPPESSPSTGPTTTPTASDPGSPPPVDQPSVDPDAVIPADGASWTTTADEAESDITARVSPDGLRKEVFGYLPYWEVDAATVLDYRRLSTIAYFGVGAAANGSLEKTTSSGAATVGWSGWTSSRMTSIINDAHRNSTRVVLTVQSFAWSSGGVTKQKALLGNATARATLAKNIATAVRDRGADGVNLDFEPIVSGYDDEFTSLVRRVRTELDAVQPGYYLTFATTGFIGNYPIEAATAAGGADAIMIMGYDYRNGSSATAGSIAPLSGPMYDITDTINAYAARVPASKLILGVPYYGRAWSTPSDALHAENASGTKYGASSSVNYSIAVDYLNDHGRRYDTGEQVAWTAYLRETCSTQYGCFTVWRQLYVDDAQALKAKYDLVNRHKLRGIGIWALGYDGTRSELWTAISQKFIEDKAAPLAGLKFLPTTQSSEAFKVSWAATDDISVDSHDVEVSIDGGAWSRWLSGTTATSATYVGARGHAFAFRARARDEKGNVSAWGSSPVAGGTPTIKVGGFGKVVTDQLNARSAAGTGASILRSLSTGDVVAFLQGPVSANGYTWYRVAAPLSEWPAVSGARSDLWIAVAGSGVTYVSPIAAPTTTQVAADATLVSTEGSTWTSVAPVRLLDTRAGNGLSGAFRDQTVRAVQIAGRGGIPADAVAVTANLTVTGSTSAGYVSIGPSMTSKPSTSTINLTKGGTLANGLTLRLASNGTAAAVFDGTSGSTAHLVLDVTGYYRVGDTGARWTALNPARLLDSRSGNGLSGRFTSRTVRTLQIAGRGGVPADAIAVTGNLTGTGATAGGFVSMGPTMTSSPSTSTLNLGKTAARANNVTLRLGSGGKAGLVFVGPSGSSAHLVFDVTGYYRAGSSGAKWYPVTPVRLLDTRSANGLSGAFVDGSVRGFQLTGRGTVPVDAKAVTANLTVVPPSAAGDAAGGPPMVSRPSTSTINVVSGQTLANGVVLRIGSVGTVGAVFQSSSGAKAHQVLDLTGYFR